MKANYIIDTLIITASTLSFIILSPFQYQYCSDMSKREKMI